MRRLLEAGADARAKASGGLTPLHLAARRHDAELVDLLLRAGAEPSAALTQKLQEPPHLFPKGSTALHLACTGSGRWGGRRREAVEPIETVKLLLDAGASVGARDADGATAEAIARDCAFESVAELIRSAGHT